MWDLIPKFDSTARVVDAFCEVEPVAARFNRRNNPHHAPEWAVPPGPMAMTRRLTWFVQPPYPQPALCRRMTIPMALAPHRPNRPRPLAPSRIAVIGNTGAGKSTLARSLADCLGLNHVELDAFQHEAGWVPADPATFRARLARAIAS